MQCHLLFPSAHLFLKICCPKSLALNRTTTFTSYIKKFLLIFKWFYFCCRIKLLTSVQPDAFFHCTIQDRENYLLSCTSFSLEFSISHSFLLNFSLFFLNHLCHLPNYSDFWAYLAVCEHCLSMFHHLQTLNFVFHQIHWWIFWTRNMMQPQKLH